MEGHLRLELVSLAWGPAVIDPAGELVPVQVSADAGWSGYLAGVTCERVAGSAAALVKPTVYDRDPGTDEAVVYTAPAAVAPGSGFSERALQRVVTVDASGRIYVAPKPDAVGDTFQGRVLLVRLR